MNLGVGKAAESFIKAAKKTLCAGAIAGVLLIAGGAAEAMKFTVIEKVGVTQKEMANHHTPSCVNGRHFHFHH